MSTAVGFSPVAPGNGIVSGGAAATAATGGDSPLGFLDALLGLLAQGTALPPGLQRQGEVAPDARGKGGLDMLANLGVAAETALTTQLPAVEAPVAAPVDEQAPALDGEQLIDDLVSALAAIDDATENGEPVDPALHKKLSEALDDIAGLLGITLPTPPAIDPVLAAAASGNLAISASGELEADLPVENDPLPQGVTLVPVEADTKPTVDLAAKFAEAVEQATTPPQVEGDGKAEAGATAQTDEVAEIDPDTPLGKLVEKLTEVARKLAARSPELGAKIEAIVQKIVENRVDTEALAKLTANLDSADIDLLATAKADAKPANPPPAPQLFTVPALPAPAAVIVPPKQAADTPKGAVESVPVEKAEPEETPVDNVLVAKDSRPAERMDAEPKVRDRGTFAAHLAEARSEKTEPVQQQPPTQAAAQVKSELGVVAPKSVHAAYQAPVQQINVPQVAFEVVRQFNHGNTRFQIRLDPPELGRIDVRMHVDGDGNVHARMTVERAETLDLMQRDQRSLEKALAQAGLDGGKTNLEFSLRQNPFARDGQGQQQQHNGSGSPFASRAADADEVPEIASTTTQYRGLATASGVNLFV
ncbi:MAG TPA: flagellar hook-length control protein FliK [Devosia sp.]